MQGIALALADMPTALIEQHSLQRRIYDRGGEREVQFLRMASPTLLPVWIDGQLRIIPWGSRSGPLPRGGMAWLTTVESGEFAKYDAAECEVPLSLGLQGGVWFRVRSSIRGVLIELPEPVVYLVVEPATHYFKVMTRSDWMPVFVGGRQF